MLRGHNSFLRTGSAVKHKTQTKEERERAEGKESKKRGREEKTDASPENLPSTSCPHRPQPQPSFLSCPITG